MAIIPEKLPTWLKPFDRNRTFACRTVIELPGRTFKTNEIFDKTLVNTRLLRLLYEQRRIVDIGPGDMKAPSPPPAPVAPPEAADKSAEIKKNGKSKSPGVRANKRRAVA